MTGPSESIRRTHGDRYRIERELGQGGMATVYLAKDLRRDRLVALKVMRPELAALIGPERFLREIEIAGKLTHPHIIPLYDAGDTNGLPFFVMPYIEGESLRDRLRREQQLPIPDTLDIVREVAGALDYAHAQGIIHRDIKPENILLSRGHALVADFGIARAASAAGAERLTGTGMAIGTVHYMSPEQATGTGHVDGRSDQYSLACVAYEVLAGGPPFAAPTSQGVLARHLVDAVPPIRTLRPTVPSHMEAAILAALAKAPADRFASAGAFVEAMEGKRPSPSEAYPAAIVPWTRRRKTRWAGAGVVVAVVAAASAWVLLRPPSPDPRRVLLGTFENQSGDPALATLGEQVRTKTASGLAAIGLVQVVDARSIAPAGASLGDLPTLRRLARDGGAGSVITGAFTRRGDSVEFEIHLTRTATGDLLRPVRPAAGRAEEPTELIDAVQQRVMAAYDAQFDPGLTNHVTRSQPGRHDAYQEWKAGTEARWANEAGREPRGSNDSEHRTPEQHFRKAMTLDPDFLVPRLSLAAVFWRSSRCHLVDSVAAAFRSAGTQLLQSDQASLNYALAGCRRDVASQYEAAMIMLHNAPNAPGARYVAGFDALRLGRPREAVAILTQMERSRLATTWRRLYLYAVTIAYHALGEHRNALKEVAQEREWELRVDATARTQPPAKDDPNLDQWEMDERAALGEVARVDALINQRIAKSNLEESAGKAMLDAGGELRAHGHGDAGRAVCARAVTWFGTRPASEQATRDGRSLVAGALYCAERWDDAQILYQRLAAEDTTAIPPRIQLAALALRRNDRAEADRWDAWLLRHESEPSAPYGRAVIAAQLGDLSRSFALFQQAWDRDAANFDSHADMNLTPLYGYPPFRALVFPNR